MKFSSGRRIPEFFILSETYNSYSVTNNFLIKDKIFYDDFRR